MFGLCFLREESKEYCQSSFYYEVRRIITFNKTFKINDKFKARKLSSPKACQQPFQSMIFLTYFLYFTLKLNIRSIRMVLNTCITYLRSICCYPSAILTRSSKSWGWISLDCTSCTHFSTVVWTYISSCRHTIAHKFGHFHTSSIFLIHPYAS